MVTLIVIVIIALGVLFFLKPFSHTEKTPPPVNKESVKTSAYESDQQILDEDVDTTIPEETDEIPPPKKIPSK